MPVGHHRKERAGFARARFAAKRPIPKTEQKRQLLLGGRPN